jgi:hypothetical protein
MLYKFTLAAEGTDYLLHTAVICAGSLKEAKKIFKKECEGFCGFKLDSGDYSIEELPLQVGVVCESSYIE